mmetsp:Transcript_59568/g.145989  ORF Transcript_59568/g.145989 Transcript_59568/m.145989 type:complete len:145 (+) Transcript_59568:919-1353(+)
MIDTRTMCHNKQRRNTKLCWHFHNSAKTQYVQSRHFNNIILLNRSSYGFSFHFETPEFVDFVPAAAAVAFVGVLLFVSLLRDTDEEDIAASTAAEVAASAAASTAAAAANTCRCRSCSVEFVVVEFVAADTGGTVADGADVVKG